MADDSQQKNTTKTLTAGKIVLWVMILVIAISAGVGYWLYRKYYPSTDDSYVQANVVYEAAQVSGPVSKIYVKNHQYVKKGEPLFDIDPRPFQAAVDKAQAQLDLATQQMQSETEAIKVARANVKQAAAQVFVDKQSDRRISQLVAQGQASKQDGDNAKGAYEASVAALNAAKNQLQQAIATLGKAGKDNANIQEAKAQLEDAKLNLGYTHVTAQSDGYLVNFTLRNGSMIAAGQTLFQLVESQQWWVEANFKETDLERIKPGQSATITVDMYPKHKFKGKVDSISSGSGASFTLLPPENATGNWGKSHPTFPSQNRLC